MYEIVYLFIFSQVRQTTSFCLLDVVAVVVAVVVAAVAIVFAQRKQIFFPFTKFFFIFNKSCNITHFTDILVSMSFYLFGTLI